MIPKQRLVAALMIGLQCLLVAHLTEQSTFGLIAAAFAVAAIFFSVSLGTVLSVALSAIAVAAIGFKTWAQPPDIPVDWLLPGRYVAAFCQATIVIQLIELLRTPAKDPLPNRFAALVLLSFLVAFCRAETVNNATFFYLVAVTMGVLLALFGAVNMRKSAVAETAPESGLAFRLCLCAVVVSGLAAGTGYFANTAKGATGLLRFLISRQVNEYVASQNSVVAFTVNGNLGSVTRLKQDRPDVVVADVYCDFKPGYLRGRVFTQFGINRWKTDSGLLVRRKEISEQKLSEMPLLANLNRSGNHVVDLGTHGSQPFRYIDVTKRKRFIGDVLFSPLNMDYVVGGEKSLIIDSNRILYSEEDSSGKFNRYWVSRDRSSEKLYDAQRDQLLRVSRRLRNGLSEVASEICSGSTSVEEKIRQVESFFRSNFKYSLESNLSGSGDSVSDFVLNRRAAHCEYFATAAAMILRLNGIPTRYVTGFIVVRESDSDDNAGEMWVVRNQDAHAWVEAFDDQKKQWVIVEATPGVDVSRGLWSQQQAGMGLEQNSVRAETATASRDRLSIFSLIDSLGRGLSGLGRWLTVAVNVLLGCALPLLVWRWLGYRNARRRTDYRLATHAARMRRLDRKLAKENLVRRPSETLHQFADRLMEFSAQETGDPWIHEAANEYRQYAMIRYSLSS